MSAQLSSVSCVISFFYIKPQLHKEHLQKWFSCVISFFYIKPQLHKEHLQKWFVALYLSSTSNHNQLELEENYLRLRYIFLLHQTTTWLSVSKNLAWLRYIFLLHQTTTAASSQ